MIEYAKANDASPCHGSSRTATLRLQDSKNRNGERKTAT